MSSPQSLSKSSPQGAFSEFLENSDSSDQHNPVTVTAEKETPDNESRNYNDTEKPTHTQHNLSFWLVFLSLCLLSFTSALDGSIITTALPKVTASIGGDAQYVWIANSFTIAQTAIQPLCAQLCDIFGRRVPLLISIALFVLGSGIAGGANGVTMLIAGRTVQGLGSGGIYILVDLIVCDLVSQRERGNYLGIVLSMAAVGAVLGPVVGGALADANWRWVFYINLPIAGTCLVVMWLFLRVTYVRAPTWKHALLRIDWFGNALFIASILSLLLGLVFGGTVYPWDSYHTLVPLILGIVGWIGFHIYETRCREPCMPPRLFTTRNSFIGFILAFDAAMLMQWVIYFLPIYFQAMKRRTPLLSGVDLLPYNGFLIPAAMVAGGIMSKTGSYRPLQAIGFALLALGIGLLTLLKSTSSRALWVIFQMIASIGQGFLATTILPGIQAALPSSDTARATGTYAFLRSFGFIWGVTASAIVFNAQFNLHASLITDSTVRKSLVNGNAYGAAASATMKALTGVVRDQVLEVYRLALKTVWEVAMAFALVGFVACFAMRHIELRTEVETEFGLEEKKKDDEEIGVPVGGRRRPRILC